MITFFKKGKFILEDIRRIREVPAEYWTHPRSQIYIYRYNTEHHWEIDRNYHYTDLVQTNVGKIIECQGYISVDHAQAYIDEFWGVKSWNKYTHAILKHCISSSRNVQDTIKFQTTLKGNQKLYGYLKNEIKHQIW